jgi:NADH:ubiquinone oxidoreductase subunit 2 (subunit N)
VELRPFLAYMSVFHIFFIFSLFLIFNSAGISFFYLITYAFLSIHIFVFLFLLKNKEIKFLADLQVLEQNILIAAVAIITIVAMSGLPPFIGF